MPVSIELGLFSNAKRTGNPKRCVILLTTVFPKSDRTRRAVRSEWTMTDWMTVIDFLYILILLYTPPVWTISRYRAQQPTTLAGLARPIRFTVSVTESNASDQVVANLTALILTTTELPAQMRARWHETHVRFNFELLDVSANLMANLPPQRRASFVHLVQLDQHTGVIRFAIPLDRERLCPDAIGTDQRCTISLLVAIHLATETVYADLTIIVNDINDNAPYFPSPNSADNAPLAIITIDEECPIGTMIQLPQATDPDTPEHGVQRYEFHPTNTPVRVREHFDIVQFRHQPGLRCEDLSQTQLEIMNSGARVADSRPIVPCLRTIRRVDRETVGDQFHFTLLASDSSGKRGEIAMQLLIRDINDHAPEWASKLELFDGSGRSHWVSASPSEPGQETESKQTHYAFSIPECTKQHKLVRLEARDKDDPQQEAGKITFRLSDRSPDNQATALRRRIFISNNHLYLTDRGLRGLVQPNLTIVVSASDGVGKTTEAWFHLRIDDCNDHKPTILIQNTDYLTIPEESAGKSHLISLITVRDFDLVTSPNSQFSCFLNDTTYLELKEVVSGPTADDQSSLHSNVHQGNENMLVEKKTDLASRRGRWSVYRLGSRPDISFDRETDAVYTVMFECIDKGSPSLTASRPITIHIEDINDNSPQFVTSCSVSHYNRERVDQKSQHSCQPQFEFTVAESAERGSLIGSVRAVDLDNGDNARIEYILLPLNRTTNVSNPNKSDTFRPETLFTVSPTGEFHLIGELDRERQNVYQFLVQATDHGKPQRLSTTATVTVHVADVNDCAPIFHGDYVFEVVESYGSSTIHQVLGTLNATDADLGRNGSVHYRLAVHLRETGQSGLSSPLTSSQVVKVSHDGQITIYGVVDREQTTMIMVDVIAEDNGVPMPLSALTTVTIHVLDLNDNKPRFVQPDSAPGRSMTARTNLARDSFGTMAIPSSFDSISSDATYRLNLSLDTSIGTLVTKFEAIDPDNGPNGTVLFELVYSGGTAQTRKDSVNSSTSTFTLHPDGRLILTNRLDFDTVYAGSTRLVPRRYRRPDHLLIRVSDQGPIPEYVITGVQIMYHDTSPILNESPSQIPSVSSPSRSAFQSTQTNGTLFGTAARPIDRRRSHPLDTNTQMSTKRAYTYAGPGKSHGLPVLYILALAICFALILVITSLVYLYFKMRKPPAETVQRNKHTERSSKQESTSVKLLNTENNGTVRPECGSLPDDGSVVPMRQNNVMLSVCDKGNNMAVAYRTLSSPYLMMSGARLSPTFTGDSYANEMAQANWATMSPGYMELTESGSHPSSFALLPSSNECTTHAPPPTSLYRHQTDFTPNSKLDNLIGPGCGDQSFCRLMRHHHTLPVCDRHVNYQTDSYVDNSPQSNKSRLIQSEAAVGVQPASVNPTSKTPVGFHENSKSKPRTESTDNSKSSAFTDVSKSMGVPAASSLLLYQSDRQPSSALDARQHLTGGSFV